MFAKRSRKRAGMALIAGFLMTFDAILHPPGARIENVQDETRRKKDAQSGDPPTDDDRTDSMGNRRDS